MVRPRADGSFKRMRKAAGMAALRAGLCGVHVGYHKYFGRRYQMSHIPRMTLRMPHGRPSLSRTRACGRRPHADGDTDGHGHYERCASFSKYGEEVVLRVTISTTATTLTQHYDLVRH